LPVQECHTDHARRSGGPRATCVALYLGNTIYRIHGTIAAWERGQADAQSTVVGLVGKLASDNFNLLRREVRRLIRSGVVAIGQEAKR
jgi:hypothetical protein